MHISVGRIMFVVRAHHDNLSPLARALPHAQKGPDGGRGRYSGGVRAFVWQCTERGVVNHLARTTNHILNTTPPVSPMPCCKQQPARRSGADAPNPLICDNASRGRETGSVVVVVLRWASPGPSLCVSSLLVRARVFIRGGHLILPPTHAREKAAAVCQLTCG